MDSSLYFPNILGPESDHSTKYYAVRPLGYGNFARVWYVRRRCDDESFAVKIIIFNESDSIAQRRTRSEIACLQSCKHFAIIGFVEYFEYENKLLIVIEYCNGGDLTSFIDRFKHTGCGFPQETIGIVLFQLVLALNHLHRKKILHRDIKSKNVFLSTSGLVKLGDFGLSTLYDTITGDVGQTFCGTPVYLAPEVWRGERYGVKADIWALGILTYEAITGHCPFNDSDLHALKLRVIGEPHTPLPPYLVDPQLIAIIDLMLQKEPANRPTTLEILRMPYMISILKSFISTVNNTDRLSPQVKQNIAQEIHDISLIIESPSTPNPTYVYFEGTVMKVKDGCKIKRFMILHNGKIDILPNAGSMARRHALALSTVKNVVPVEGSTTMFDMILLDGHFYTFEAQCRDQWIMAFREALAQINNV